MVSGPSLFSSQTRDNLVNDTSLNSVHSWENRPKGFPSTYYVPVGKKGKSAVNFEVPGDYWFHKYVSGIYFMPCSVLGPGRVYKTWKKYESFKCIRSHGSHRQTRGSGMMRAWFVVSIGVMLGRRQATPWLRQSQRWWRWVLAGSVDEGVKLQRKIDVDVFTISEDKTELTGHDHRGDSREQEGEVGWLGKGPDTWGRNVDLIQGAQTGRTADL